MSMISNFYKHPISVDEMYCLTNHEEKNWGIEGYEIHKNYFDYAQIKKDKERNAFNERVWSRRPNAQDKDKNAKKPIIAKRPNYLDEVIKKANSFYNKEKAEKLMEELKEKSLKHPENKNKEKKEDVRRAPRVLFTDWMIKNEKKKNEPNKDKDLTAILEKIKKHDTERQKLPMDIMKDLYTKKTSTSKCERVNMTSEAVFFGEQIPFYSTAPLKDGAPEKFEDVPGGIIKEQVEAKDSGKGHNKLKNNKVLFFPRKYFISAWQKAPSWVYPKESKKNTEFFSKIENDLKEKRDKVLEKLKNKAEENKKKFELDNVPLSWHEVNYHGRNYLTFPQQAKKADWYPEWRKNNPQKSPGPQQYWKRYPVKYKAGQAKPVKNPKEEKEEGKAKQYILEDIYTGKKYYKPMNTYIF